MFRIDSSAFRASLGAMEDRFTSGTRQALAQAANFGQAFAKATPLFKDRTGALRASIRVEERGPWHYRLLAGGRPARYGVFVHDGTAPHMIVGNPTLTFVWKGVLVHFRYVNHPGTKPRPFMLGARNIAEAKLGTYYTAGGYLH